MNPLVELESFYVTTRRQAESGMMPIDEAVQLVNSRTITDAAGVIWRVDVNSSTQTKAAFLAGFPGQEPKPADPSSFAAAASQPAPPPTAGSYQMAQPFSGVPAQPPTPLAPLQKQAQSPSKSSRLPKSGRISDMLSSVSERFAVTPKMVTALVAVFVILAASYAFIKMRSGDSEPVDTTVSTTTVATTSSTVLVPSTPPTSAPTSPPPVETTPSTEPPIDSIAPLETIPPLNP